MFFLDRTPFLLLLVPALAGVEVHAAIIIPENRRFKAHDVVFPLPIQRPVRVPHLAIILERPVRRITHQHIDFVLEVKAEVQIVPTIRALRAVWCPHTGNCRTHAVRHRE